MVGLIVVIHVVNKQKPASHQDRAGSGALNVSTHRNHEGQNEVTDNKEDCNTLPTLVGTMAEPCGFLGNIPIPNQHILTEAHVGPEAGETKHQLCHIMEASRSMCGRASFLLSQLPVNAMVAYPATAQPAK